MREATGHVQRGEQNHRRGIVRWGYCPNRLTCGVNCTFAQSIDCAVAVAVFEDSALVSSAVRYGPCIGLGPMLYTTLIMHLTWCACAICGHWIVFAVEARLLSQYTSQSARSSEVRYAIMRRGKWKHPGHMLSPSRKPCTFQC